MALHLRVYVLPECWGNTGSLPNVGQLWDWGGDLSNTLDVGEKLFPGVGGGD